MIPEIKWQNTVGSEMKEYLDYDQFINTYVYQKLFRTYIQINDTSFIAQSCKINKFTIIIFYAS